ncbi:HAMP domain-containing histidine kinase [Viridibacillus sp. YIM B01967]|uniref:histidine kinase n=1 Tax=Viridibacillus soli TaxID=2798301 RepID=A0ABS1HB65_9BACL|nr:HAMP domain-containing sensor histidine kinase [Viridibacillus soli]MBK3496687.1 HAMP domain-containing histidine kinase [Viridibacillus soli]
MKKWILILKFLSVIILFLIVSTLFAFISFHITSFLYSWLGKYPQGFWQQLYTVIGVFVLFGCTVTVTFLFGAKRQRNYWETIVDALRRIAKGDFSVKLDLKSGEGDQFGQLISGINDMAIELGEMEKMRQEFISNVSHEIQSPLTSINGFAKALKNIDLPDEKRHHYLEIIEMESKRLSKISDNLLKLTSLESQHHPFEPKQYRLDKQLRNVVLSCEPRWLDKNIEMDIELGNITIVADEDLMNQVWMNLLSNSIKFTPNGGTIRIRIAPKNDTVTISIIDTGIGMTEGDQQHIFERFFKADQSRAMSNGGSGLGLSIVKKIIDMHNGSISVQSKLGEQTTFLTTMPLEQGEPYHK